MKIYENFRKTINKLIADETADERHAHELLTDEWDEQFNEDFPELQQENIEGTSPKGRIHLSDEPHSCKQILSGLVNGIPQLKEGMDRIIRSRSSPSKLIHNSDQLNEQYSGKMLGEQIWRHRR